MPTKETVNAKIIEFLKQKQGWSWGGQIEDYVRGTLKSKASNTARVCRKLHELGIIDRKLESFEPSGRQYVQYRIREEELKLF